MLPLTVLRKVLRVLPPRSRLHFWGLLAASAAAALLEVLGIGGWVPFVAFASAPGAVQAQPVAAWLRERSGVQDPTDFLVLLASAVVVLFVAGSLVRMGARWAAFRFTAHESHRLAMELLGRYLARPYSWLLGRNTAVLARNVVDEVQKAVEEVIVHLVDLLLQGMLVVLVSAALLWADPRAALGAGGALLLVYLVLYHAFRKRLSSEGEERARAASLRARMVQEALSAAKEARVPDSLPWFAERFREQSERTLELQVRCDLLGRVPSHLTEIAAVGGLLSFMVYFLATRGPAEAYPLIALFLVATIRTLPALQEAYLCLVRLRFYLPSLDRLLEDLEEPAPSAPSGAGTRREARSSIRLRGITFRYPGSRATVLEGADLEIRVPGSTALVGRTGAGKTTLADLAAGLLVPEVGALEIDGQELGPAGLPAWQRNVGCVPQSVYLLDDTVRRNIALGVPDGAIDEAAVRAAARAAHIHGFLEALPEGYGSLLGERGVRLSGGQRQRIGIARALYRSPGLLILDEATNALDSLTQREVMEAVEELSATRAVLVIAHRLSTVAGCGAIAVVEGGRVADRGTFPELLARSAPFRELVRGEEIPTAPPP